MTLQETDLYKLDINKEWVDFWEKNKDALWDKDKIATFYFDCENIYKKLGYYPVEITPTMLRLYKNNALTGGNTVDFLCIGLLEPKVFNHMNFSSLVYNEIIKYGLNKNKVYPNKKEETPKFIKVIKSYGYRVLERYNGTISSEWLLIKNLEEKVNCWRIKLGINNKPILSELFSIPKTTIKAIIEINSRETDKEKEYIKYFGLLNKNELLEYEIGLEQDKLKVIKTSIFENLNRISTYFEWLKENKLEDNLKNADKYYQILVETVETETKEMIREIKREKGEIN